MPTTTTVKSPLKDPRSYHKAKTNYTECIRIIVGTGGKQKQFMVHTQLLTSHSLFFKKALSGIWVEAIEQKVKLPEDDHATFQIYVNLLYTDQITISPESPKEPAAMARDEFELLVDLYTLVDKLQDIKTKQNVLVAVIASSREVRSDGYTYAPGSSIINKIYTGTISASVLRRLVVNLWTANGIGRYLQPNQTYPTEFLHEVLVSLVDK